MAGLAQIVLGLFLQFTQPAEARTTMVKEAGVQESATAELTEKQASPPTSKHFHITQQRTETVDGKRYTLLGLSDDPYECSQHTTSITRLGDSVRSLEQAFKMREEGSFIVTYDGIKSDNSRCIRYERVEDSPTYEERCTPAPQKMALFGPFCRSVTIRNHHQNCVESTTNIQLIARYEDITDAKREGTGWTERDNLIINYRNENRGESFINIEFEDEGDPVQASITAIDEIKSSRAELKEDEQAHAHDPLKLYADVQRRGYAQAQAAYKQRQDIHRKVAQNGLTTETGTMIGRLSPEQQTLFRAERECMRNPATCQSTYH